jgi:AraC-like DNA-binding protein
MAILAPLFGIFTSFILIYYLSSLNRSNIFLALFFLCCNLVVLVYFGLHFSKNIFWEGICFVHWLPLSYLLGPLLFFYVKTTLTDNKKLKKWDWLHLIPAILCLFATLPFTTLPFKEKMETAHRIVNITNDYRIHFFVVDFEFILISRSLHVIFYSILSFTYFKWITNNTFKRNNTLPSNHKVLNRWFLILCAIQIVIASNTLGNMLVVVYGHNFTLFGITGDKIFSDEHFFGLNGIGFFAQNFFLFLFPKILYGNVSYSEELQKESIIEEIKSNLPKKIKPTVHVDDFEVILENYLSVAPFTKKEFTLSQMSFDLKIPERFLSTYFNNQLDTTFSEWRKNLRIDYVCKILEQKASKNLTIEAISANAGFASRSKFIDAFKERKGVTPSAYIKSLDYTN